MAHSNKFQDLSLKILNELETETQLKALQGFSDELESFRQRINDNFFRLAVIGEFSSGKSTFINALIGKDILSHAVKETTAVLTRIVNVAENDPRKGTAVAFMKNGQKLNISNLEELKEYTTAVSTKFQVAKDIDAVEIYMPVMHTNRPLMIMDTPGLNGIAEGHLEQTKDIVTKAHACIYLIQKRGLTKDDIEFLKNNLLPFQRRFIFVQNFIDEFKTSEGETLEDTMETLRQILTEKVFGDSKDHTFFICGISALKELVSRDTLIKRLYATDDEDLTDSDRKNLSVSSNFSSFKSILSENFSENQLDEIQYKDTAVSILQWLKNLQEKISRRLSEDSEIYKTSHEKNVADKIDGLIQKIRNRRADNLAAIKGFISGEIRKLNSELKEKIIPEKAAEIVSKLAAEINSCSTPNEIENKRSRLPKKIEDGLEEMGKESLDYCKISFQDLHQRVMERVEEYSGIHPPEVNDNFDITLNVQQKQFSGSNYIRRYEDELQQKKAAIAAAEYNAKTANSKVYNQEATVQRLGYNVSDARNRVSQKQNELRRLGSRPEERVWEEKVEREGFFGSIRDFFGKKTEERRDDSAGIAWENRRRELQQQQNRFSNELDGVLKDKAAAERILNRYKQDAQDSAAKIRRLENEIIQLESRIATEKNRIQKEEVVAKENFVRRCKNQLCEEVSKYFNSENDGATEHLLEELKKITANVERKITDKAENNFNDSINKKLADLEQVKSGNVSPLQKKITGLEQSSKNLKNYAKQMEEILNG